MDIGTALDEHARWVASRGAEGQQLRVSEVAEPSPLPASVVRIREGAGMFAAIGAGGAVALVRPSDGAVVPTWNGHAIDAVPIAGGLVSVDQEGNVRVGCQDGSGIRTVVSSPSGVTGAVIQVARQRLVLAGASADPVRMGAFVDPCGSKTP